MSARPISTLVLSCLVGCVSYQRNDATPESIAASVEARAGGAYGVDGAILLALLQNPQLRALEAHARAAGATTLVPLPTQGEWRGRNEVVGLMLDPIALLTLGPRGAAIDSAHARHREASTKLVVARWQVAAAVVEEFLIQSALSELSVSNLQFDIDGFQTSGLASPIAIQQLQAAQARATSEQIELRRAHNDSRARLRQLLGLPSSASLTIQPIAHDWLQQPAGLHAELLTRPDLRLSTAQFEVADADFRQAVAEQYPSFQLGPNISLLGDPLRGMGVLRLPIGMHGLAKAASERREAARCELEALFLQAKKEATLSEENLSAAIALSEATGTALRASSTALMAARTAIEVEVDAFTHFSNVARMVMRDTMEHRHASIAKARAQIQRAISYGWPRNQIDNEASQ